MSGLVEGIRYVVFNFGCALAEITPFLWVFLEAMLICFFGGPNNTAVKRTSVIMVPSRTAYPTTYVEDLLGSRPGCLCPIPFRLSLNRWCGDDLRSI